MLRNHFRKEDDPYAGADRERAVRLSGALWALGAILVIALLPVAPPTAAVGSAGWAIAAVTVLGAFAAAARCFTAKERVGYDELLATSYAALVSVATMEWLAGGRASPYHQLFLLGALYTASAHPPRRFAVYFGAFLLAIAAPFAYGPTSVADIGDAALQVILILGFAMMASILMVGVRAQRLALHAQGAADRHAAETDQLTGLGNRRALMADLERQAETARPELPLMLALFDLDGFKAYNDAFGHPAGDAVLARLARRLEGAVGGDARAYRMGGDEFCVLAAVEPARALAMVEAAGHALSDEGDGFTIGASHGTALLPTDTSDAHDALRIADTRMYARKNLGRTSAGRQSADVLMSVLSERDPAIAEHIDGVAETCVAVGRTLGMDDGELALLRSAGALHGIGKLAIPDAILSKPGPLTEDEWQFVRRHTVIGERILRAAPALAPVAPLVRSSHEHFDGSGYPDALAGEQIPLAGRIVAVCDAFDAMTSMRPYRTAMSTEGALEELRACAGSQFDPMVVAAFEKTLRDVGSEWSLPSEMRQA
jgi:two-component system, cell cycle response regulator